MRTLHLWLTGLLVIGCGTGERDATESQSASLGLPEPPPLPGDAADDDLVVKTDKGDFELVIDSELPRTGGYVKALELRLAVTHRRGLQADSKFESGILVGSHELVFKNGRLFLGKTDYGEIHLPTKIGISSRGVVVDGKQRGDLPDLPKPKGDEGSGGSKGE